MSEKKVYNEDVCNILFGMESYGAKNAQPVYDYQLVQALVEKRDKENRYWTVGMFVNSLLEENEGLFEKLKDAGDGEREDIKGQIEWNVRLVLYVQEHAKFAELLLAER